MGNLATQILDTILLLDVGCYGIHVRLHLLGLKEEVVQMMEEINLSSKAKICCANGPKAVQSHVY